MNPCDLRPRIEASSVVFEGGGGGVSAAVPPEGPPASNGFASEVVLGAGLDWAVAPAPRGPIGSCRSNASAVAGANTSRRPASAPVARTLRCRSVGLREVGRLLPADAVSSTRSTPLDPALIAGPTPRVERRQWRRGFSPITTLLRSDRGCQGSKVNDFPQFAMKSVEASARPGRRLGVSRSGDRVGSRFRDPTGGNGRALSRWSESARPSSSPLARLRVSIRPSHRAHRPFRARGSASCAPEHRCRTRARAGTVWRST
jgi:hypothetical protein